MKHLEIALSQYGMSERLTGDNPVILNYAADCGMDKMPNDEMSWCSIFMNWVCFQAGLPRSDSPAARSWLKVGEQATTPTLGDVVVFWRVDPNSWQGHVGLFINFSEDRNFVYVLGGNQCNRVCIQTFSTEQVLQFRKITS